MSSSSSDLVRQRQRAVEVYLPEEVQGEGEVGSSVASTAAGSAASTAPDIASLVEKALAKLPPEMAAEAKDPKIWQQQPARQERALQQPGLRIAPPESPVTGYMFGKGVYFADMFSKSANYCYASDSSRSGVLLLCEVALGDMNELLNADYDANDLPKGKLSTKGVGQTAPDLSESKTTNDGVVVPLGKPKQEPSKRGCLLYNEYIVYNVDQIRMRYVLHVSFNFKRR